MVKIKTISLSGLRGVKGKLELPLNKKSALFYGDNGSGKSSIVDAFEWFYFDRVDHLSNEEIGRNILDAMRNFSLEPSASPCFNIEFTDQALNADRTISLKKTSLTAAFSNNTPAFNAYLEASRKENLILRYRNLGEFILSSKTAKLEKLSEIIGFGELIKTRAALKKALNDLNKEMKNKNFESQIGLQQSHLIKYFNQNITSENQFIECTNDLLTTIKDVPKVVKFKEIEKILEQIKKPKDSKIISVQVHLTKISDWSLSFPSRLRQIENDYEDFYNQFQSAIADVENLKKIVLEKLLSSGKEVLDGNLFEEEVCPLCLQSKSKEELKKDLAKRLLELEKIKEKKLQISTTKQGLQKTLSQEILAIKQFAEDSCTAAAEFKKLHASLQQAIIALEKYSHELDVDLTYFERQVASGPSLKLPSSIFSDIQSFCSTMVESISGSKEDANISEIHIKIALAKNAFLEIVRMEREKESLATQIASMSIVYAEFVKVQKNGLSSFLESFSKELNEYYEFMNPDEKIESIQMINIEKDEELLGLTLQVKFWGNEITPPQKFLSESHLNCIGIAFFLASVKAFNKHNHFFILDDVISSFDSNHRVRFADLLTEKFSDYQIFLFTHEKQWFDYLNNKIKNKGWLVKTIKWTPAQETHIEESIHNLQERIEYKIANNVVDDLGNDIRKLLENRLKEIAQSCQVRVKYLSNERNEDRMAAELLSELRSKIKASKQLEANPVFERLSSSLFVGNKDSHDSSFTPSIGDLKAFWKDVSDCINLFLCQSCNKFIAMAFYDNVGKKIRCMCGVTGYDWKN